MTRLVDRAAAWLIAPAPESPPLAESTRGRGSAAPPPEPRDAGRSAAPFAPPHADTPQSRPAAPRVWRHPVDEPPLRIATSEESRALSERAGVALPPLHIAREDELIDLDAIGYGRQEPSPHGSSAWTPVTPPPDRDPPRVVVLGPPADVPVAAAAAALQLRRRLRSAAAVVVLAAATEQLTLPPAILAAPGLPGAGRLATRLARRGLPASAHGRLVWIVGPPSDDPVSRIAAAAGGAPVLLALLGPRSAAADDSLAEHDAALLAADPASALAELAAVDLERLGVPMRAWAPPADGIARLAALAGWRPPPGTPDLATRDPRA